MVGVDCSSQPAGGITTEVNELWSAASYRRSALSRVNCLNGCAVMTIS